MARIRFSDGTYANDRLNPNSRTSMKRAPRMILAEAVATARMWLSQDPGIIVFDDYGSQVELVAPAKPAVSTEINWLDSDGKPVLWRFTPEKLADGQYSTPEFYDAITDTKHRVKGNSPQDVFERLIGVPHPIYQRYINTLSTVEPPAPPAAVAPVDDGAPKRYLRPADNQYVPKDSSPCQRIQTAPATNVRTYDDWFNDPKTSSLDIKKRLATDPAFAAWVGRDAVRA